jgi:hypothetical protein
MRTPEMHLITSGGGGAFAHPTHDQKREFKVRHEVAGTGKAKPLVHETSKQELPAGDPRREPDEISFRASRRQFYPSKARSRLLALRNLLLPFHNWRFAAFLGVVYALFAWVFQIAVADPTVAIRNAQHVSIEMKCLVDNPGNSDRADLCSTAKRRAFDRKLSELTAPGATALSPSSGGKSMQGIEDEVEARLDRWLSVVEEQGGWWSYLWSVLSVQFSPDRVLGGMLASPFFFLLVAGLWIGLVQYASVSLAIAWLRWPIKLIIGTTHATAHLTVLLATNSILMIVYESFAESQSFVVKLAGTGLYAFLMVLIGGILGALVFGVYWVITSVLFGMHQDSFSALGVKKYKNFLRMKFEENKVTIYPIALDKVPNRWGWRESEEGKAGKGSLIEPKKKMRPRLIEGPITIDRDAYVPPI